MTNSTNGFNRNTDMAKFVYLVHAKDTEFYKVGISRKPKGRLAGLQTGCPIHLSLILQVKVKHAEAWEEYIHGRLGECKVRGEWFRLDQERLERVKHGFELLSQRLGWPPNMAQPRKQRQAEGRQLKNRKAQKAKQPKCIKFPYNGQQGEVVLQKYQRTGHAG